MSKTSDNSIEKGVIYFKCVPWIAFFFLRVILTDKGAKNTFYGKDPFPNDSSDLDFYVTYEKE